MKTPAGTECKFFYGDYYRGRSTEECRLIGRQPRPNDWQPELCRTCPVPGILQANACEHMALIAKVRPGFLGLFKKVHIEAFCNKTNCNVSQPEIGCGECHQLPSIFFEGS